MLYYSLGYTIIWGIMCKNFMEAQMSVGNRIIHLREKFNVSQDTLAKYLKIDRSSLSRSEHGKRRLDSIELLKIASFFHVSTDYLLGVGFTQNSDSFKDLLNYPIVGTIKSGPNGITQLNYSGYSKVSDRDIDQSYNYYWLRVVGNSMIGDGILGGDLALIKQTPEFENGDIYAVIVDGEEGSLKHVEKRDNTVVLTSSNPIYSPRIFVNEDCNLITIAGKLVQIKRKYN